MRRMGRPKGQMTRHRKAILHEIAAACERGEHISLAELARRTGMYDYRDARRVLQEIQRYGLT